MKRARRNALGQLVTPRMRTGAGKPARSQIRAFLLAMFILGCEQQPDIIVQPTRVDTVTVQNPGRTDTLYKVDSMPVITWRYDTLIVTRRDTVTIERPGKADTVIVRTRPDTVLVPTRPDTVFVFHVDTVIRIDTLWRDRVPGPAAHICLYMIKDSVPIIPLTFEKPFCGAGHFERDTIGMRTHAGPAAPARIPTSLILPGWWAAHP